MESNLSDFISVSTLCYVNIINYMDRFTIAGILSEVQIFFNANDKEAAIIQSNFLITYTIFCPLFGYLGDHYNRKYLITFGLLVWAAITLTASFLKNYWMFVICRGMLGFGEASFSTIAPTLIVDMFDGISRIKMLTIFYLAIPFGAGLGYAVGEKMSYLFGSWQWALRATPPLGFIGFVILLFTLKEPKRGQIEGIDDINTFSFFEDMKIIWTTKTFLSCTFASTCVFFSAGSVSWWGPKVFRNAIEISYGNKSTLFTNSSVFFGTTTIISGIVALLAGFYVSKLLREKYSTIEPIICGAGLIISAPVCLIFTYVVTHQPTFSIILLFIGQVGLSVNWALFADLILSVVMPCRRSLTSGSSMLFMHVFGDCASPFITGIISDILKSNMKVLSETQASFYSLRYSLFFTWLIEIIGGFLFIVAIRYLESDRKKVADEIAFQLK